MHLCGWIPTDGRPKSIKNFSQNKKERERGVEKKRTKTVRLREKKSYLLRRFFALRARREPFRQSTQHLFFNIVCDSMLLGECLFLDTIFSRKVYFTYITILTFHYLDVSSEIYSIEPYRYRQSSKCFVRCAIKSIFSQFSTVYWRCSSVILKQGYKFRFCLY